MEFDLKNLDYLKYEIIQILNKKRSKMKILAYDLKLEKRLIITVFDNFEEENQIYKIYKILYDKKVTSDIYLRDTANEYPFLVFESLGPDLAYLFKTNNNKFDLKTIMLIGYKMVF